MTQYYRSQMEYGRLNMCTVVCHNVAMSFLQTPGRGFSADEMDCIMRRSAVDYLNTEFAADSRMMGVFDIAQPAGVLSKEFGGMLVNDCELSAEDMILMPLAETLQILRESVIPVAFIATFSGHSIVFLAMDCSVRVFDPLPALMEYVTPSYHKNWDGKEQYSGVLFGLAAAAC
jgi:hypothetical protein